MNPLDELLKELISQVIGHYVEDCKMYADAAAASAAEARYSAEGAATMARNCRLAEQKINAGKGEAK